MRSGNRIRVRDRGRNGAIQRDFLPIAVILLALVWMNTKLR